MANFLLHEFHLNKEKVLNRYNESENLTDPRMTAGGVAGSREGSPPCGVRAQQDSHIAGTRQPPSPGQGGGGELVSQGTPSESIPRAENHLLTCNQRVANQTTDDPGLACAGRKGSFPRAGPPLQDAPGPCALLQSTGVATLSTPNQWPRQCPQKTVATSGKSRAAVWQTEGWFHMNAPSCSA